MEFSDDFNSFKINPLSHKVMDFSTDYASLTLRRRRSNSIRTQSCTQQKKNNLVTIMRQLTIVVIGIFVLLVTITLPKFYSKYSKFTSNNYISMWENNELLLQNDKPLQDVTIKEDSISSTAEALNSLAAALEKKKNQKISKAKRLFLHALALAPHNPKILLHYGQFLEEEGNHVHDLVEADHQYARAVAFSVSDIDVQQKAIMARKRTASKVEIIDDQVLEQIDQKKARFLEVRADSAALRRAKKEAYIQYIYHTVGIEGNTMNLAQTRSILETKLAVAGKSIMEHNEILGMDSALKYINNTLVDKVGDITLQDILEMHRRVIGNVDPVEAGLFRRTQVYVGDHVPPPPTQVYMLVLRFVEWLNSPSAMSLHPVRLAALAHYKLVHIHPFVDGNGRTSRLLMNLVLMQAGYPPVIIRRSDRDEYYKHLVTANEGDIRPFIRFIAQCTENTLNAYLWASQEYITPETGELESLELPRNLVEHSAEEVVTDLNKYKSRKSTAGNWLNFESSSSDKIIIEEEIVDPLVINMEPVS